MTRQLTQRQALDRLAQARQKLVDAEDAEFEAAAEARRLGATWQQVAEAVGMKQPNAFRRYRRRIQEQVETTVTVAPPAGRRPPQIRGR